MKKKEETIETPVEIKVEPKKVSKLDVSFGSEDLNKVVDKINEIIDHVS